MPSDHGTSSDNDPTDGTNDELARLHRGCVGDEESYRTNNAGYIAQKGMAHGRVIFLDS